MQTRIGFGEPFVGRAGQLMDMAFQTLGIKREDVYIANIVNHKAEVKAVPVKSGRTLITAEFSRVVVNLSIEQINCLIRSSSIQSSPSNQVNKKSRWPLQNQHDLF